ncbi:hypothetical protein Q5P01_005675 [Channa striata]|uniref:Uncharacterized protein n=1 Tax=Channa striata TaxID=64152 RepID=A0AA88NJ51_CHASR|nr:hypothetical protein Q5P01_005675 [Channa striata]
MREAQSDSTRNVQQEADVQTPALLDDLPRLSSVSQNKRRHTLGVSTQVPLLRLYKLFSLQLQRISFTENHILS